MYFWNFSSLPLIKITVFRYKFWRLSYAYLVSPSFYPYCARWCKISSFLPHQKNYFNYPFNPSTIHNESVIDEIILYLVSEDISTVNWYKWFTVFFHWCILMLEYAVLRHPLPSNIIKHPKIAPQQSFILFPIIYNLILNASCTRSNTVCLLIQIVNTIIVTRRMFRNHLKSGKVISQYIPYHLKVCLVQG